MPCLTPSESRTWHSYQDKRYVFASCVLRSRISTVWSAVVLGHTDWTSSTAPSSKTLTANQGSIKSTSRRYRQQIHTASTADQTVSAIDHGSINSKGEGAEVELKQSNDVAICASSSELGIGSLSNGKRWLGLNVAASSKTV